MTNVQNSEAYRIGLSQLSPSDHSKLIHLLILGRTTKTIAAKTKMYQPVVYQLAVDNAFNYNDPKN